MVALALAIDQTRALAWTQAEDSAPLEHALAIGERILGSAEAFALTLALDVPDLPPVLGSDADQANLRSASPLYLAAELERAGVLPAVETLAGLAASGAIKADLGPAAPLLFEFWRNRKERLTAEERAAFYARLFGHPTDIRLAGKRGFNDAFEAIMIDLTEALANLDPSVSPTPSDDVRIRTLASELASNLLPLGGGVASFAARDMLNALRDALAILKQPQVQAAFGARGVWGLVRTVAERYGEGAAPINAHLTRGRAGMMILAWLADIVPRLEERGGRLVASTDDVVTSALEWLQATTSLAEEEGVLAA